MTREVRYYFGRLNLIPTQSREQKREILLRALRHDTTIERRGVNWGFYQVRELKTAKGLFIHGFLVKYKPFIKEQVAVPETREFDEQTINNWVSARSRFFLHQATGLIVYHPTGRDIRSDTFRDRFAALFEEALGRFFIDAEIQTIEEQYRFFDALRSFERISRVSVYLHPANPDLTETTRRIHNRLRQLRADSYKEQYDASEDSTKPGLEVVDDAEMNSKFALATDGFGKAAVTGTMSGRSVTVTTADNPIIAFADSDEVAPERVLEQLQPTLDNISERFEQ